MKKTLLFVLAAIFACYTMNAQQILFSDGFEEGLAAWTTIDDDGDGYVWGTASVGYQPNSGSFSIISGSYDNNVGPLTPDNWLITATPITLGASCAISWWDAAQDATYSAEHYAVYVSTGNTVSDFTAGSAVFETTLNSSTWTNRMVDLTSYAGQTVYVAFRHFNCIGQFYLKLDDVQVIEDITVPEISLSRLTVPATVDVNTPFTMSGVVTNPSTVALTSFKVSYTLDGENSGDITISGINVPLGGTYAFSHTAPAFVTTGGLHNFSITVSEPNGEADITADNTLNGTFLACVAISTFPYVELFEDGTLGCWQTYDEDGDGDAFEYTNAGIGVASESYMVDDIDNWLFTPALQIPETGTYYAIWSDFCYDANNPDKYSYYIGTSPSVSAYASATPIETVTSDTAVNQRYVSLAEYAGQTIYMAFRHHDCAAGYIIIDGYTVMDPNTVLDTIKVYANETMGTVTGGGVFEDGTEITISATPNNGYRFVRWNDNNTDNPRTVVCEGNATYIAYFAQDLPTYHIDVVSADPTMGSATGSGDYVENSSVTISAIPNSGYHFTSWQDNVTSNPRTITVTGNATYTAYFESDGGGEQPSDNAPFIACVGVDMNGHNVVRWEPRQGVAVVRYNIYREGLGGYSQVGYVTATNATEYSWVDDNSNTATQAYSYKISEVSANGTESDLSLPHTTMHLQISQGQGTTWNLSWTPYVGFNYSGYRIYRGTSSASMSLLTELSSSATTYSDNAPNGDVYYQIEVVSSGAKSITASSRSNIATSVQNQQFTITVLSDNTSMGTVSGGGTFAEGATATISATPLNGYTFSQWSDGSTQAQRTITVTGNATYTAYFTAGGSQPQQYLITVVSNNPERGTVSGGGLYDAGAVITITAEPFAGFEFVQWQDGNTNDFRAITVMADATYTAYFRTATEGIDDVKATNDIKIYTRGNTIVIDFSGQHAADSRQSVVVYDVMGRVIKQAAGGGQWAMVEIPVSGAGVYMVKVGEMKPQKVVVRR